MVNSRVLVLAILIVLLVGAFPAWSYNSGWGYYPFGGLGGLLMLLLILAWLGIL